MAIVGVCRECGCTEDNACVTESGACWWINDLEKDLCSACVQDTTLPDD